MPDVNFNGNRQPPQYDPMRRPNERKPRIEPQAWEAQKDTIRSLYLDWNQTLVQVKDSLEAMGFSCSRRQLVVQLRKWDIRKQPRGPQPGALQHAQNSNGNDECRPPSCLWPNTTTANPWLHDDSSDLLGFSTPLTSFTEPPTLFSQQHTVSAHDTELLMDLSGASDLPFAPYVWNSSFDMSTTNDPAGFSQQEAFFDRLALDFTGDIAPVAETDVDVLNQSSSGVARCRSCCDGSCMRVVNRSVERMTMDSDAYGPDTLDVGAGLHKDMFPTNNSNA
ncbi:hypothetical protein LTR70_001023 [Exophiala xenobiotica]|uniref:Clr5 domain-containing protein n=1 Tax=Lithohypha guttulata TaxID=1690604 RepID=A0ABR0KPP3_9EURO|nr:hypothetical protein LTR24_000787 [Lithohypha guttulata]KAK5328869.1 hypothetical protein LTR70_001023 [Exophiala xenobiotica]